jgi:hypothetical protein
MALTDEQRAAFDAAFANRSGNETTSNLSGRMAARTGKHKGKGRSTKAGRRAERVVQSKQGNKKTVDGVSVTSVDSDDCHLCAIMG